MENQIKEIVEKYKLLVNTQDEAIAKELFIENASLISITNVFKGRDSIYKDFFIDGIRRAYTEIKLISDSLDINIINENTAIVIFGYRTECIRREDCSEYGIKGLETQLIVKVNGEWKIQHVHYSK